MKQTVRLGRVAGIDIGAHWSALVIAALLGYVLAATVLPTGAPGQSLVAYVVVAIVVAALFLAGLLAHELAHALTARRYRVNARRITLWLLGGVSELQSDPPTPRAELLVAAVGPITSLLVGGVAAVGAALADAGGASQLIVVGLTWLAVVNVFLALFNLLPGAPLDGGRIVRALVWRWRGDRDRAQIAANRGGVVVGILLAVYGGVQILGFGNFGGLWLVLLGWFLVSAANAETATVRLRRALDGRSVRDIMTAQPAYGRDNQTVAAFLDETASRQPHATYPVIDRDGRLVGLVRLADLARIPESGRSGVALGAAATSSTEVPGIGPGEPAETAARNLSPANPLVPVTDNERLVGVVSPDDVEKAVALAELGRPGRGREGGPPAGDGRV